MSKVDTLGIHQVDLTYNATIKRALQPLTRHVTEASFVEMNRRVNGNTALHEKELGWLLPASSNIALVETWTLGIGGSINAILACSRNNDPRIINGPGKDPDSMQ